MSERYSRDTLHALEDGTMGISIVRRVENRYSSSPARGMGVLVLTNVCRMKRRSTHY
jgi:hypothetical protein